MSIKLVVEHYRSLLITLESIYKESGPYVYEAGGLLLAMRSYSHAYFLCLLPDNFCHYTTSNILQNSHCSLISTYESIVAHDKYLSDFIFEEITKKFDN